MSIYGEGVSHEATELTLFIENDADLYRQQMQPILKNLITKMARGVYDKAKAEKLWMYLAESGAKKYAKEFATPGEWNRIFTVPVRKEVARILNDGFLVEANLGNYNNYLPKKYASWKPSGGGKRRSSGPLAQWRFFRGTRSIGVGAGRTSKAAWADLRKAITSLPRSKPMDVRAEIEWIPGGKRRHAVAKRKPGLGKQLATLRAMMK